jgi:mono/diheme cytochrome c family protein
MPVTISHLNTAKFSGVLLLIALAFSQAGSADVSRGEALYENHCSACHEINVHQRSGRKVSSMLELRGWVASWSAHGKVDWDRQDIEDVTRYLSDQIYHFSQ